MWLRVFQHLLPRARAWRITVLKTLRLFFEGLTGLPADARHYIDDVFDDLFPDRTRQLAYWEQQFGISPSAGASDSDRRARLSGEWKAQGGQSPAYLQSVVQAAGFPLYIHEWWDPAALPTVTVRDPHVVTNSALIGTAQCRTSTMNQRRCRPNPLSAEGAGFTKQWQCNAYLVNETNYIVNLNLTRQAPPPISSDASTYTGWIYWGAETFGDHVSIPAARRGELERLLKKICPAHLWLGVLVDYV